MDTCPDMQILLIIFLYPHPEMHTCTFQTTLEVRFVFYGSSPPPPLPYETIIYEHEVFGARQGDSLSHVSSSTILDPFQPKLAEINIIPLQTDLTYDIWSF